VLNAQSAVLVRDLASTLFFCKRKQKHKDAQAYENCCSDQACRCNLSARLKARFQMTSNADQKGQKSQADKNDADRFFVFGRNLHLVVKQSNNDRQTKIQVHSLK